MAITIDFLNKQVLITSPTVIVEAQDVYDYVNDVTHSASEGLMGLHHPWEALIDMNAHTEIFYPRGKNGDPSDPLAPKSQIDLLLNPYWQLKFWGGSGVSKWRGGRIVGGIGDITLIETPVNGTWVGSQLLLDNAQMAALSSRLTAMYTSHLKK